MTTTTDQTPAIAARFPRVRTIRQENRGLSYARNVGARAATGEVLAPNAPGRDPIVTRVIWLSGMEPQNKNAYGRCIYIHGTPEERHLGKPSSYGCIRMRSKDVVDVYKLVRVGTHITISDKSLSNLIPAERRGWFGVAVLQ